MSIIIQQGLLHCINSYGNKYYKSKNDTRWVVYKDNIEASKITSDWFLWIHHTINEIPSSSKKKYLWQKQHIENQTGTSSAYKPNYISKLNNLKKKYETWQS